mgnify:CR=1 FL=1
MDGIDVPLLAGRIPCLGSFYLAKTRLANPRICAWRCSTMKTKTRNIQRDTLYPLFYTVLAAAALLLPELMFGGERNAMIDNLLARSQPLNLAASTRVRVQGALTCQAATGQAPLLCSLKTIDEGNSRLIQISGYLKNGIAERITELYRTGKTTVAAEGELSRDRSSIELSEVESI